MTNTIEKTFNSIEIPRNEKEVGASSKATVVGKNFFAIEALLELKKKQTLLLQEKTYQAKQELAKKNTKKHYSELYMRNFDSLYKLK